MMKKKCSQHLGFSWVISSPKDCVLELTFPHQISTLILEAINVCAIQKYKLSDEQKHKESSYLKYISLKQKYLGK